MIWYLTSHCPDFITIKYDFESNKESITTINLLFRSQKMPVLCLACYLSIYPSYSGVTSKQFDPKICKNMRPSPLRILLHCALLGCLVCLPFYSPLYADDLPSIEDKTTGMEKKAGLFDLYWDADMGDVYLEVAKFGEEFLYLTALRSGLGSNDIGLDRGLLGSERVVHFERVGRRAFLRAPNLRFRSSSSDQAERRSIAEAFAEGTLFGFDIVAQTGERALLKANDFFVRDHMALGRRMGRGGSANFRMDKGKSSINPDFIKSFPKNNEVEARLTFTSDSPSSIVRSVSADPNNVSLVIRHSFIELPEPGFEIRDFHPRTGFNSMSYYDYSSPIGQDMQKRNIVRHRLKKKDPNAKMSEAVEPIVFYLDPGTPEPVRSALLDGARWWNQAFESAGYVDAFQVEVLPDGADPLDVRYNTIQWVHRSTRGWSYGRSVIDPRTGEIIKGHVSLGSLRVRQDYLIALGLLNKADSTDINGKDPSLELSLARLRQLSAHEVGHTLGIMHNFAASGNNRASVMDYPAPYITLDDDGDMDLSKAYATGIGDWDKISIRYGYGEFPQGEADSLAAILNDATNMGLEFITDTDARPIGGAHPRAHLWDNESNVIDSFKNELAVREKALNQLSAEVLREGQPFAQLEEVLVPIYLRHRYQVEALVKNIGGVNYSYSLKGDAEPNLEKVPGRIQLNSLKALLEAVHPDALKIPDNLLALIPPRPPGYSGTRELFDSASGMIFDPYAPAENVLELIFSSIANPERSSRLLHQGLVDGNYPGLGEILTRVSDFVLQEKELGNTEEHLRGISQRVWLYSLINLFSDEDSSPEVKAEALAELNRFKDGLLALSGNSPQVYFLRTELNNFFDGSLDWEAVGRRMSTPPGSPIGCFSELY